ncbi:hypothetical protein [Pseudomonas sp. 10-1B]|uniref:hypothetical protein n=1 Tax=Pseudomonas sp. 10-1B TaxID=1546029 RepID=UPI000B0B181B|nr:hypothetical protein [Pseudomonas sp. 10-1B]
MKWKMVSSNQRLFRMLIGMQIIVLIFLMFMGLDAFLCSPVSIEWFPGRVVNMDTGLTHTFSNDGHAFTNLVGSQPLKSFGVELSWESNSNLVFVLLGVIGSIVLFIILRSLWFMWRARKTEAVRLHLCAKTVRLAPHVFQWCGTCGARLGYPRPAPARARSVWVIEIILNTTRVRKASALAIKDLQLPVIRTETNLIVIGVYRNKAEPAAVIKLLKERYDVRGWMVEGN